MKTYPKNVLEAARQYIKENESKHNDLLNIIPIFNIGFIAAIKDSDGDISFRPYIQNGTYGIDFINLLKSHRHFENYQESIVALIAYKNLGDANLATAYVDIFCNNLMATKNSINPTEIQLTDTEHFF